MRCRPARFRLGLLVLLLGLRLPAAEQAPPNVVVILADDLGWADLGCHGADLLETPRIDLLAKSGLRFTQAYAMSVCSPSRAMLLTGRHAARIGMTIWSEGARQKPANRPLREADSLPDLPHTETTLASRLRAAGYFTGLVGKWHLGDADHAPETHGFDVNIGGTHWGAPQTFWWPYRGAGRFGSEYRYVPHLEFGQAGEYLTDRLTTEALRFIDHAAGRPFFLLLAHHAPHTPIEAKPDDVKYFAARIRPGMRHQNPVYAAMVRSLDESVGRVVDHLQARGLAGNTLVVFASDNGGYVGIDSKSGQAMPVTSNAPLRSGKGSLYEGGIRIPLILAWPGRILPGGRSDLPVTLGDLFPTLLTVARAARPTGEATDGVDLAPLLRDAAARVERDALYFHYPHYYPTTTPVSAIRVGSWKLIEFLEDRRVELFDLSADPGEADDRSAHEPTRVAELRLRLERWRQEVGARMPSANPGYSGRR